MTRTRWIGLVMVLALALGAVWFFVLRVPDGVPVYGVDVAARYPHDRTAFTEGLFFQDGQLYEGTGEVGTSYVRRVRLQDGQVVQQQELPSPYFGEGVVAWKDRLYQLTWKDQTGFVYNLKDFTPTGNFTYQGEGWGLTHNGKNLIMSDGSATLRVLDPDSQAVVSTIRVTANGCPVDKLNELEWIDGQIYANIWQTSLIARIDPATGHVTSFLDIGALKPQGAGVDQVANGIAWDAAGKRLFVTGKMWPQLYQVTPGKARVHSDDADRIVGCGK